MGGSVNNSNARPLALEDQLRNMMLSNVSISNRQPQNQPRYSEQQNQPQQNFRGRGRGRGITQNYPRPQQPQYQSGIPPSQQQGFNQFLGQHVTPPLPSPGGQSRQSYNHYDPNSYQRGPSQRGGYVQPQGQRQLYNGNAPRPQSQFQRSQGPDLQSQHLQQLSQEIIPLIEMTKDEREEKDEFRAILQTVCRELAAADKTGLLKEVSLENFGSLASGFATKGSDMDLVVINDDPRVEGNYAMDSFGLPRMLETKLLRLGYGARLLGRARVPIIKVCEKPTPELLAALKEERAKWDALCESGEQGCPKGSNNTEELDSSTTNAEKQLNGSVPEDALNGSHTEAAGTGVGQSQALPATNGDQQTEIATINGETDRKQERKPAKAWSREKAKSALDFPKDGIGIQCDINFFNPLGLYNTRMLRCYSLSDPRVRDMVLFVKTWAKKRKINHPYSGTLSSYGYVLMVLHYLVNIVQPPVVLNLQHQAEQLGLPRQGIINDWEVRYYDEEAAIIGAAEKGSITTNKESVGSLLKGFFQYYAVSKGYNFNWMKDVLSLRTRGGLLSKDEKGWTGAKTETTDEGREVRQRYLFAIEDPFELNHNVARTVTHNGIVAVRDEFRRAWRILLDVAHGQIPQDGQLLDELNEVASQAGNGEASKGVDGFAVKN